MRCKPGELAVVVDGDLPVDLPILGKIRRVLHVSEFGAWGPRWEYEGERLVDANGVKIARLADSCLRPIRPDEAPEQSVEAMELLAKPGLPTTHKESA